MSTAYDTDIIAWSEEQVRLLRSGNFSLLDIEHIAEEIEGAGKSERRELASRIVILLAHLLKWQFQPGRRGSSWQRTIKEQRRVIQAHLKEIPSLKASLGNETWFDGIWADVLARAIDETGLDLFPEDCQWSVEQIFAPTFYPEERD